ncbi:SDR family oxidoreductase [Fructilactobacillus cliffordii]|uniref:SDR family oxidoreductase n=1 Tax=Fructilactobacillus cliffordii TaxID=2940299 RepID=A0A9Q9E255_9LACO|nr:SDR family oxidoreductase [Fructilactobacillus cliffordii]USS89420.1 SDR family oxidoreductase [Fructilactobacillus cliffordii]
MSIKDKVIVITGGSSGMGAATAKFANERGAKVVIGSRNQAKLDAVQQSVAHPENFATLLTDVTKFADVQALVQLALDQFGQLDVMYNNAGIMPKADIADPEKLDVWQGLLETNVMGVLNGIAAAVPTMRKQGHGLVMATDSVAGHKIAPGFGVYGGTKFAVKGIMEGLRQEEHANGIQTGIVSPGFVNTNLMNTLNDKEAQAQIMEANNSTKNGWLSPENIAELTVFMMSQPENVDINEIIVRPTGQDF